MTGSPERQWRILRGQLLSARPRADPDRLDAAARAALRVVPGWRAAEVVGTTPGRNVVVSASDPSTRAAAELRAGADPFPDRAGWARVRAVLPLPVAGGWADAVRRSGCDRVQIEPLFDVPDSGFALLGHVARGVPAEVPTGVDRIALAVDLVESRLEAYALHHEVAEVHAALESNRRIGVAVGIVVERLRVTEREAFAMLRAASQQRNVKLRDIADEVVLTGEWRLTL